MKVLLILSLVLFLASFFAAWQKEVSLPFVSSIMTVSLAIPALYGLYKWIGYKKSLLLFILLASFSYTIESIGLLTHLPYGAFTYGNSVGILINDFIPLTLPFAWAPLVIGAGVLSLPHKKNVYLFCLSSVIWLLALDALLDPGAVFLKFWVYEKGGVWYGVPLSNYIGWIMSGTVGSIIMWTFIREKKNNPPFYILWSYIFSVVFWIGVCLFASIWGGVAVGILIIIGLLKRNLYAQK